MIIQVEFWQIIAVFGAMVTCTFGFGRLLLTQFERRLTERFASLEKQGDEWQRLERDWLSFKADLPIQYVRREDYVRNQTVIEAKIDAIAMRLENWQLRGQA